MWSVRDDSTQHFYLRAAIAIIFIVMAATWDILIVPSAGAIAFLLLGMLSIIAPAPKQKVTQLSDVDGEMALNSNQS